LIKFSIREFYEKFSRNSGDGGVGGWWGWVVVVRTGISVGIAAFQVYITLQ
jgi:hypothetical protein